MPAHATEDASPEPEPDSRRPSFLLLHVPPEHDPFCYQNYLVRLSARFRNLLVVASVVDGAMPTPPGVRGPAFILFKDGHVVAEAFGDVPIGEIVRLVEHALPAVTLLPGAIRTAA